MSDLHWTTAITSVKPNEIRLRGYRIDELIGQVTFGEAVYLALKGERPSPEVGRLMNAMLVSSIDHGATPPSVLAARTAASTGATLSASLAAGVLAINRYHGGAIEGCMRLLVEAIGRLDGDTLPQALASKMLAELKVEGKRAPGFGHRIHTDDPRTRRLLALADELQVGDKGVMMARAFEEALEVDLGRRLPLNVDGALAALLVDLGFPPELGNAFFIATRVIGLAAHVHEEMATQRPMRRIHPTDHEYDGPDPREWE
ncbi:MAG TPA: citryl-CoA lyase [Chloroflexi bacterium]|nr:citryl-CoA lyase [Chloroflexota bacterium]